MPDPQEPPPQEHADREKRKVALSSVLAAVFLTAFKIVVGIVTGSLGILSEAAHSGLDLVAAMVTYFAVRISGRPADERYTYGYGKVENLSALFETLLLLLTCVWIIYEAIQRLFYKQVDVEASFWAFLVMGISIFVDIGRSRALSRAAKKFDSQALEADALHFSTDIWSSSVVIVGLFLVLLSEWLEIPWLVKADALAAIGVAGIVIYVSIKLGYRTITALLDAVPAGVRDEIINAARVPGVQAVRQVRVRKAGPEVFTDITLSVSQETPLEQAHDIASKVEKAVADILPGADVLIYFQPGTSHHKGIHNDIRRLAEKQGLRVHSVRVYENEGHGMTLELHVEVSEFLRLDEAHDRVSHFENELREARLGFEEIVTHIEPIGEVSTKRMALQEDENKILEMIQELQGELNLSCNAHHLRVHRVGEEISISFHAKFDGDIPIRQVHECTEQIERLLRNRLPELGRVVIHTEPIESAQEI